MILLDSSYQVGCTIRPISMLVPQLYVDYSYTHTDPHTCVMILSYITHTYSHINQLIKLINKYVNKHLTSLHSSDISYAHCERHQAAFSLTVVHLCVQCFPGSLTFSRHSVHLNYVGTSLNQSTFLLHMLFCFT